LAAAQINSWKYQHWGYLSKPKRPHG
jgi:hypothetical protein